LKKNSLKKNARAITVALAAILCASAAPQAQPPGQAADNVILITLDGARVQEMFGGLDLEILQSTLKKGERPEGQPVYRRFWADSAEARRGKPMPFFWNTLMAEHGSIAGNAKRGSGVRLTNRHRFSYPGYSEILTGEANDEAIKSNDPIRNPRETVLEIVRERLSLPAPRVAAPPTGGIMARMWPGRRRCGSRSCRRRCSGAASGRVTRRSTRTRSRRPSPAGSASTGVRCDRLPEQGLGSRE
jgi:hypothetical protein